MNVNDFIIKYEIALLLFKHVFFYFDLHPTYLESLLFLFLKISLLNFSQFSILINLLKINPKQDFIIWKKQIMQMQLFLYLGFHFTQYNCYLYLVHSHFNFLFFNFNFIFLDDYLNDPNLFFLTKDAYLQRNGLLIVIYF